MEPDACERGGVCVRRDERGRGQTLVKGPLPI